MPSDRCELNNPELLQWARQRAGLEHWEIADELGVNRHAIWAWEDGKRQPTYEQLKRFAEVCQTNVPTLFLPEPPEEPMTAERHQQIIGELEYVCSLTDGSRGIVLEAIDGELIDEAVELIREALDDER